MRNAGQDELQAVIKIGARNINNLRYVDDTTLKAENEEELKSLLMRVKEESERAGLKLNVKKLRSCHLAPFRSVQFSRTSERGKGGSSDRFPLLGLQNHCGWWLQPSNQKMITSWQESDDKPRQCFEKQRHY